MITKSSSKQDMSELLIEEKLITERQLQKAIDQQKKTGDKLEKILVQLNYVTEKDITEVMGKQMGVAFVDLDVQEIDSELIKTIPEHLARRYKVVPVGQVGSKLSVAMADPLNVLAIDDIRLITGFDIQPMIATEASITRIIDRNFGVTELAEVEETVKTLEASDAGSALEAVQEEEEISVDKLKELVDEAPIVRVVNLIISQAINDKASDIHVEPEAKQVRVRYRIDGVLHDVMSPPKHIQAPMISRIKIMSSMDIAERRVPQDGKIHLKHNNKEFDLRVSTIPTVHGEKAVLRILDKSSVMLGLDKLGFYPDIKEKLEGMILKPYGMILVTGPTGSGKSTTLYSCLNKINTGVQNIITIEDPVEYQLPGVNQVQVNEKAGLSFANALRSFLRQDPDIIMVGEIRDTETARIAIEAALTGHLVLSTLHTNDAPSAINRLVDMGIEPFLIASALIGVQAQRLARLICPNCKEPYTPPQEAVRKFGLGMYAGEEINFYKGRGCDACKNTGYKGRSGIYELMMMTDRIRGLTLQKASSTEIRKAALEEGMRTLQDDGIRKVLDGITSIEETLRVVYMEGE
ncbi:MAG: type IV-A pilus assembly ATPase PilB [Candidatus Eremiobacteraeota bacterium]|nr:type IV-A pilus assembly ATPase PilB [Candidatus Eremiobacteraeota bacterium]MCL5056122.1 type IV-A pilus assembly ATPase PilB [Bacillota bacterium]